MLAAIVLLAVATLLAALLIRPSTFDSMTYHLGRVEHWITHASVDFYPTHIIRQLIFGYMAELQILHLHLLAGQSDRFDHCVQWFAWLACMIAVARLVQALNGSARAQLFAAFFIATTPMALLQASSTQNDLVCGAFLAAALWFALDWFRSRGWERALWTGLVLGLALCTKGTAYLLAAPFAAALGLGLLYTRPARPWLGQAALIAACVFTLNGPLWVRNTLVFSHPLGDRWLLSIVQNRHPGVQSLVSTALRDAALHAGGLSGAWASRAHRAVSHLHEVLGWNPNDPATTVEGEKFEVLSHLHHEDYQGNPLHALLAAAAIAVLIGGALMAKIRRQAAGDAWLPAIYSACLLAAFVAFWTTLLWQPWNARLHTPFFILAAVPAALALDRLKFAQTATMILALPLASLAALTIWHAEGRKFPDVVRGARDDRSSAAYLKDLGAMGDTYGRVLDSLPHTGSTRVGLVLDENSPEYQLWRFAREHPGLTFEHVAVRNRSAPLATNPAFPDFLLLVQQPDTATPETLGFSGYSLVFSDSTARLFQQRR